MKANQLFSTLIAVQLTGMALTAQAADVVKEPSIGMELARDIASESIAACREDGYQVSAVVVDRYGLLRAALRDDRAARFTLEIAERKATIAWLDSRSTAAMTCGFIRLPLG